MKRLLLFVLLLSVPAFISTGCKKAEESKAPVSTSAPVRTAPAPERKPAETPLPSSVQKKEKAPSALLPKQKTAEPSTALTAPEKRITKLTVPAPESMKVPPVPKKPAETSVIPSEDITAPSEIVSTDIKKLDLKKYKGRVVLLMFFATWCGPCREITPEVRNLYTNYKQKGLNIIAVSVDSVPAGIPAVNSYVQKNSIKYPVFVDDGSLSKQYGIVGIPAFILIGKDGVMKTKRLGAQAVNDIAEDIKALL